MMEYNDIYDKKRNLTGKIHLRGTLWKRGEYGLVVCVWVYDGKGKILMTRRAPQKSFPGTWENSGGAAKAGEDSLTAIVRELYEETGIRANAEDFDLLESLREGNAFYDHYCLKASVPIDEVVLLEGETDDAKWVTFPEIHQMIEKKMICKIIAKQFLRHEKALLDRQTAQ